MVFLCFFNGFSSASFLLPAKYADAFRFVLSLRLAKTYFGFDIGVLDRSPNRVPVQGWSRAPCRRWAAPQRMGGARMAACSQPTGTETRA